MKIFAAIFLAALNLSAQTNNLTATNATAAAKVETNQPPPAIQRAEQIRAECLAGRRIICGKILKILPDGLVVDSGYTDLLRSPLNNLWLIPGSVTASRPVGMVESREPGSVCVGVVFLTYLPKPRGGDVVPKQYDYVVVLAYPDGQFTYTSVGTVQKTVRQFSSSLIKAVNLNIEAAENPGAASGVK
jgi:hypothetical protein